MALGPSDYKPVLSILTPCAGNFIEKCESIDHSVDSVVFENISEYLVESCIVDDSALLEDDGIYTLIISGGLLSNQFIDLAKRVSAVGELIKMVVEEKVKSNYQFEAELNNIRMILKFYKTRNTPA